jgi:hypothetical protein
MGSHTRKGSSLCSSGSPDFAVDVREELLLAIESSMKNRRSRDNDGVGGSIRELYYACAIKNRVGVNFLLQLILDNGLWPRGGWLV